MPKTNVHWLNGAVLYQIYPRSFCDSNSDGIGDLRGIASKLDYLKGTPGSLDVDIIWLSPIYPSPMADFGYDVSNYTDIDPLYGTLDDFRYLLTEAHKRDLKLLMDFIPNHTSIEHDWFKESRSSKDNPKRNWYVWKDPKADGSPPNNWLSNFGGSAWTFDETTGQYYLHSFLKEQPDLNWDNPDVRSAMHAQMKFWLDMGVDGFRVDAVSWISKDPEFRNEQPNLAAKYKDAQLHDSLVHEYSQNGPHLYSYLEEIAELIGSYNEGIMITEAYPQDWTNTGMYRQFYDQVNPTVSAPFNFMGIFAPWDADAYRSFVDAFQDCIQSHDLAVYCFGNHDRSRLASRVGNEQSKVVATTLLTLPGMATLYYGDELGMPDGIIPPEKVQDPFEKNVPGKGFGRDPSRTPMLWNNSENAGFSTTEPWLPIHENYQQLSVDTQKSNELSHLNLYKKLITLRKQSEALTHGTYESFDSEPGVFAFKRENELETMYVFLNFTDQKIGFDTPIPQSTAVFSTQRIENFSVTGYLTLRPFEAIVLRRDQ